MGLHQHEKKHLVRIGPHISGRARIHRQGWVGARAISIL
jgi:hypothetical protein